MTTTLPNPHYSFLACEMKRGGSPASWSFYHPTGQSKWKTGQRTIISEYNTVLYMYFVFPDVLYVLIWCFFISPAFSMHAWYMPDLPRPETSVKVTLLFGLGGLVVWYLFVCSKPLSLGMSWTFLFWFLENFTKYGSLLYICFLLLVNVRGYLRLRP